MLVVPVFGSLKFIVLIVKADQPLKINEYEVKPYLSLVHCRLLFLLPRVNGPGRATDRSDDQDPKVDGPWEINFAFPLCSGR